ncbi:uncharacterized protein [Musca autumnalis]|uniref:uncharacterized protein n=1 Tax=Musca autumnalis TaxID=221902 RepID=UPI003CF052A7
MASTFNIEKLEESNYGGWWIHMKSLLIHSDLWGYVCGEIVKPEDGVGQIEWNRKDQKALSSIFLCMKSDQLSLVKNCVTSREAWVKLEEKFQPRGPSTKVLLFRRILSTKMNVGQTMNEHLKIFNETTNKLHEIDVNIPDEILVIILLSSLPEDYESFVVAMESRDSLPSLAVLNNKLLEEFERRTSRIRLEDSQEVFLSRNVQKSLKINEDGKILKRIKCFKCGKAGHIARDCFSKSSKSNAMLHGSNSYNLSSETWVLDSGATCHMCCTRKNEVTFRNHKERIELAGGYHIFSEGICHIKLETNNGETIDLKEVLFVPDLKFNFISIAKLAENKQFATFDDTYVKVRDIQERVVLNGHRNGNLYVCETKANMVHESKAYRLLDIKTGKLYKCRDVKFLEDSVENNSEYDIFPKVWLSEDSFSELSTKEIQKEPNHQHIVLPISESSENNIDLDPREINEAESENEPEDDVNYRVLRSGKRIRLNNVLSKENNVICPKDFAEAVAVPESDKWIKAMENEFQALMSKDTWELVRKPENERVLKNKWVYTVKQDKEGKFDRLTRYATVRTVLALAVEYKLFVHQLDVTTAYLNGTIDEDIFMEQPKGFEDPDNPDMVCKLKKSIYGLKQSGRMWNEKLDAMCIRDE